MVYIKFESNQQILKQLNLDIKSHKFQLVEYEYLQQKVQEYNSNKAIEQPPLYLHQIITPQMIYQESDKISLQKFEADNTEQLVEERRRREARINERKYQESIKGFQKNNKGIFGGDLKDMEKSVSFGVSFIFSFFLSGVSGYYLGKSIMGLNEGQSMVLAVLALIGTLILESIIFIIKMTKSDKIKKMKAQNEQLNKQKMASFHDQEIIKITKEYEMNILNGKEIKKTQ